MLENSRIAVRVRHSLSPLCGSAFDKPYREK